MRRTSVSRKIFVICNTAFLLTMALLCLLPLVNLFAISLSGKSAANSGAVTFWPIDFTLLAYEKTFQNNNFIRSLVISFLRTGLGTVLSMFLITTAGYALSKDFRGRTQLMWFFVFTMLFGGGLIPTYLVNSALGLKNNFLVYVLPGAFSCYNLILIMNFFRSIPKSLEEAALIDG
ncbi:MAG TPA: carbohydrate ABC transporter permease, partial [Candidatus Eisenbergiella stercorigallinarum]|nr:carbohydrate ABC transporter permease [Candidatus Eisenbergiella stercorigallinarum]